MKRFLKALVVGSAPAWAAGALQGTARAADSSPADKTPPVSQPASQPATQPGGLPPIVSHAPSLDLPPPETHEPTLDIPPDPYPGGVMSGAGIRR